MELHTWLLHRLFTSPTPNAELNVSSFVALPPSPFFLNPGSEFEKGHCMILIVMNIYHLKKHKTDST